MSTRTRACDVKTADCFVSMSFAGLVVLARSLNPIPSRTRPLNSSAPMVLWLKPWESRSLPGLPRTWISSIDEQSKRRVLLEAAFFCCLALLPSVWPTDEVIPPRLIGTIQAVRMPAAAIRTLSSIARCRTASLQRGKSSCAPGFIVRSRS